MIRTAVEYLKIYRQKEKQTYDKKIKIALLSNFTIKGFSEILFSMCYLEKITANMYEAPYNQYTQEIINENSGLYLFNPDIVFLMLERKAFFGDYYFNPYRLNQEERTVFIKNKINELIQLIDTLNASLKGKVIVNDFPLPAYSPLGISESKQNFGFIESIQYVNEEICKYYKKNQDVFIFHYGGFISQIGEQHVINKKMYFMGDFSIDLQMMPELAHRYMAYVKSFLFMTKKCLVLDLDNTLWGGVIGEDGIEHIKLSKEYEGKIFYEFQKYILSLHQKGIILAINSKNNWHDVEEVFDKHPFMVLRKEHFASIKVNWEDKAKNMREIAHDLNIGLDSMVFMDDDLFNRKWIEKELEEVLVIDMPENAMEYAEALKNINSFDSYQITEEDINKNKLYNQTQKAENLKKAFTNLDDYLKDLQLHLIFEEANAQNMARIAQLTQKTNQFNLTTKRFFEEDLWRLIEKGRKIFSVRVLDKFGDNGICGILMYDVKQASMDIDNMILSCRVLGRNIEKAMLDFIFTKANENKCKTISGEIIFTNKNIPSRNVYKDNGFTLVEDHPNHQLWENNGQFETICPHYIKWEVQDGRA